MALIVLGAGATRGASFINGGNDQPICVPPLDGDFFTQLQRVANPKHKDTIDGVLEDVVELFGHNFRVTLEIMFTTIEHTLRVVNATKGTAGWKPKELEQKRVRVKQAIAAVLEESLTISANADKKQGREHRECDNHKALVEKLTIDDSIISFNYDCLIDHMLKSYGTDKWNARYGYRLPMPKGKGSLITGEEFWTPANNADPTRNNSLRLLKLHGSIHFLAGPKGRFSLKERPYTRQKGNLRFEIIPPEWNKHFDEGVFRKLWGIARDEIHGATTIVVIGYSFPPTDLHTSALFRVSVKPNKLKRLVIVNPDPEARRRTRDVLLRGFAPDTRVLVFDRLSDFAKVDRKLWDA
ncbi:MAG: SIR2 family protein [Phycisphaerae bacterium]